MIGQSFGEVMDCGNFFDNMDDLMEFPTEDVGLGFGNGDPDMFPSIWSGQPEAWPGSDPLFISNRNSEASTELYVPFEKIVQMEQQPFEVVDNSCHKKRDFSVKNAMDSSSSQSGFRSSSPVSVLESSTSSIHSAISSEPVFFPAKHGRPRTKRSRRVPQEQNEEKERESLVIRFPKQFLLDHNDKKKKNKKKKKKIKKATISCSSGFEQDENESHDSSPSSVRKCMHCEVTKTPQWRLGPMGPKTLCNACGVRYKSGRLFPEYRPAASPTFSPSIHSNSHKKVVEMRSTKSDDTSDDDDIETANSDSEELIPNSNSYIAAAYV